MLRIFTLITLSLLVVHCSPEHRAGDFSGGSDTDQGKGEGDGKLPGGILFSEVVQKVFQPAGCFDCHGKYKNYATMAKVVVPGSPETSKLYLRASTDMPPIEEGYLPLSPEQVELIREWIAQGAQE